MFNFLNLQTIHLEITNRCQASCPMCARNIHGGLKNPLIKNNDWRYSDFTNILTSQVLEQIKTFYFCGNFGDPIINADLPKMCEYARNVNPHIKVIIHTNGSAKDTKWWNDIAKKLPIDHNIVFAIDGLKDTHHIYRIGTNYNTIIENAKSFINSGGNAEWCFIKFKHNEHQVEEAESIAKQLKFKKFTVKNSSRFIANDKFPVLDKRGKEIYNLFPPSDNKIKFITKDIIDNYKLIVENTSIDCFVEKHKEVYIDTYKHLYPCCYLGSVPYTYIENDFALEVRKEIKKQHNEFIDFMGGYNFINTLNNTIERIMASQQWNLFNKKYFIENKMITCVRTCGKLNSFTSPYNQKIKEEDIYG